MIDHPLAYWLAFSHNNLAYQVSITQLLEQYKHPEHFVKDNMESFKRTKGIDWSKIEKACRWADLPNQYILTYNDSNYPSLLKEIPHPPPILYLKGQLDALQLPQLAIVGSRFPSHSGRSITETFTKDLINVGFSITSGLALGIDGTSHQAALQVNGHTIAVLGNGLHSIYPKQHRKLAEAITQQGCLISEFPLDAQPNKKHFPQRNRIISGLSLGTLVIEAKLRSGSLITARYAAEQGREVFAVPGSIRSSLSQGCHRLLRDGATLTESVKDILDTLDIDIKSTLETTSSNISKCKNPSTGLDPQQQLLLACVDYEGTTIDEIIQRSGGSTAVISRLLLNLELNGYISSTHQGYARVK